MSNMSGTGNVERLGAAFSLALALLVLTAAIAVAQPQARAVSVGFSSAVATGGAYGVRSSVGQPVSGLTSGPFQVGTGFWYADVDARIPSAVEIDRLTDEIPRQIQLDQNYPNPFNPTTNILVSLPERRAVYLAVYNTIGQRVSVLIDGELPAGVHRISWDARDEAGRGVASGVYLYRLVVGDYSKTRTMTLLK